MLLHVVAQLILLATAPARAPPQAAAPELDLELTQRHLVFAPGSDWEFAFCYAEDACPNINPRDGDRGDVPDSMPIAWYNRRGAAGLNRSSLISATSQGVHSHRWASICH
jgi:hypothetical protein